MTDPVKGHERNDCQYNMMAIKRNYDPQNCILTLKRSSGI